MDPTEEPHIQGENNMMNTVLKDVMAGDAPSITRTTDKMLKISGRVEYRLCYPHSKSGPIPKD